MGEEEGEVMANSDKGFATLRHTNPQKMREICSKGGKAAHAKGTAHTWTSEEAREAGRKGGLKSRKNKPATEE